MSEKRKNILMWGLYALFFLIVLLLQDVLLGKFAIAGVRLLLIPMAVACVAVQTGAEKGGAFALAAGVIWALSGAANGGVSLVALTFCGLGCGYLCDAVFHRRLGAAVLLCLMTQIVTLLAVFFVRSYLEAAGLGSLRLMLRQILLSLPLSPLFYWCCREIRKVGA